MEKCFKIRGCIEFKCILSFDLNDESFHKIMVPHRYSYGIILFSYQLVVFKGSLALIAFSHDPNIYPYVNYNIWVMEDYGVAESWTKKCVVSTDWVHKFYGYTDKGDFIYPESLNQNVLAVKDADWLAYIANSVESLVLLDEGK